MSRSREARGATARAARPAADLRGERADHVEDLLLGVLEGPGASASVAISLDYCGDAE